MLSQQWSEPFLSLAYGLMGELESTQQIHFRHIPQAEFVPQSAEHDLENNVGRQFEEVEWSPGSLIEFTSARPTAEHSVSEIGATIQVPGLGRLAVRTDHGCRALQGTGPADTIFVVP